VNDEIKTPVREFFYRDIMNSFHRSNKLLNLTTNRIDGSFVQSFAFKDKTGYSGKHHKTRVKISVVVEGTGIPLALVVSKDNIVDITFAEATVANIRITKKAVQGSLLNGDKGYDVWSFGFMPQMLGCIPTSLNVCIRKETMTIPSSIIYMTKSKVKCDLSLKERMHG
jgi:Transposase DDE domain